MHNNKLKDAIFPADAALKGLNNTIDKTIAKNERDIRVLEAKGDKVRRSRFAIVRSTFPELKTTTIPSFVNLFPEGSEAQLME